MEKLRPDVDGHTQAVVGLYRQYVNRNDVKWVALDLDEKTAKQRKQLQVPATTKIVDDEWSDFEPYVDAWLNGPTKEQIIEGK